MADIQTIWLTFTSPPTDGLMTTSSTSLHPSASEALRPAAPPPSQQQFALSQQAGPGSGYRLQWEQQLVALSEDQAR